MYIWRIDKLVEELTAGNLPENESFKYLVANTVLISLSTIQYSKPNQFDLWTSILAVIVAVAGVFFIYKCNGASTGKDIIIRYLSVGWVVLVRICVLLMLPSLVVLMVIQEVYMGGIPEESTSIDLVALTLIEVIYIFCVARYINKIAIGSKA